MNSKILNLRNIDMYSLGRDLLRGLWVIIMIGCIGTMVTYTYIKDSYVPQYSSSAIYIVTPRQSTGYVYTNKRFAESAITVFQNLLGADIMKNRIKKELNIESLNTRMNVKLITETNLMKITATSGDPIEAFKTIGAIMDNYDELSEYLTSDAVFDTLKEPMVATHPDNVLMPQKKSIQMGLLSAFIAMIFIMTISLFRKTIKTEAAIEEQLNSTLYGTIYHENKNRTIKSKIQNVVKSLLITSPVISTEFVEAINSIRIKMEYENKRNDGKNVYLITSVCENEGKSTVALNVGLSLAKAGKKVIMIDADMRKPALYKMLDIPKENVIDYINVLQGRLGLEDVIYDDKVSGIKFLMSTQGHSSTYEFIKSGAMQELIGVCSKMAEYVIIDTPPMSMVYDAEVLADKVDFSLLVIRQDLAYEKGLNTSIEVLNNAKSKFLGSIFNNYRQIKFTTKRDDYYNSYYRTEVRGDD